MNYKALAEDALDTAKNVSSQALSDSFAARAQVYATLHLAEVTQASARLDYYGYFGRSDAKEVDAEIRAELGIK